MNDLKNINYLAIAKNCGRTTGAAEVIDGVSVTGVQLWSPTVDLGTPSLTYYGPGEVLLTDNSGRALTTTTAVKALESITIHARSLNGTHRNRSKEIRGKDITQYFIRPYEAPVECFGGVTDIDASLSDFPYQLSVRVEPSIARVDYNIPLEVTVGWRSAVGGSTAAEIYAGLAAELNTYYSAVNGEDIQLQATAVATGIHIVALENPWNYESRRFHQTRFTLSTPEVTSTIVSNLSADITFLTVDYLKANKGAGHYKVVAEQEFDAQRFLGVNRDADLPSMMRPSIVALSAQEFMLDGVTPMQYDELVLNWNYTANNTLTGTNQRGHISIFLPVESNTTNQVDDIIAVMDKFVVTEFEVTKVGTVTL